MRKGHDHSLKIEPNVFRRGRNYYVRFRFRGKLIKQSIGPKRSSAAKVIAKIKTEIAENRFLDVQMGWEGYSITEGGLRRV